MYKTISVEENIPLILCTDLKYNTWVIYLNPQQIDENRWEWWVLDFIGLPTIQELKDVVNNFVEEEIKKSPREEFVWTSFDGETFNIDFTFQKELELRSLYGNLPFDYTLGKNYEIHTFESSEELDDLFTKFDEFCLSYREEMETMRDNIDWSLYELALEEAKNN